MEKIKILDLVKKKGMQGDNHLSDMEGLLEDLLDIIDTKLAFSAETEFEIDFYGTTHDGIEYLEDMLLEESNGAFTVTFINTEEAIFSSESEDVSAEVDQYIRHKITIDNLEAQLKIRIEDTIKKLGYCMLDFIPTRVSMSIGANGTPQVIRQGSGLNLGNQEIILLLVRLKTVYEDKLVYTGLSAGSVNKLTFAMNYFTLPQENVVKYLQKEYLDGDLVFINHLLLVGDDYVDPKAQMYDPRKRDDKLTVASLLTKAVPIVENLNLGVIKAVTDKEIEYYPIRITTNRDYVKTKHKSDYKYELDTSIARVSLIDLEERKVAIHGADMSTDAEGIYKIVDIANAPRTRGLIYTSKGEHAYLKLTTPKEDTAIKIVHPSWLRSDELRKAHATKEVIIDIAEIL